MIADHIDFFESQVGSRVYLHTLFVSIWDVLYKAGRLLEESVNMQHNTYPNKRVPQQQRYASLTRAKSHLISSR